MINILRCPSINFEKSRPIQFVTYGLINGLVDFKVVVIRIGAVINEKLSIRFVDLEGFGFDDVLFGQKTGPILLVEDF